MNDGETDPNEKRKEKIEEIFRNGILCPATVAEKFPTTAVKTVKRRQRRQRRRPCPVRRRGVRSLFVYIACVRRRARGPQFPGTPLAAAAARVFSGFSRCRVRGLRGRKRDGDKTERYERHTVIAGGRVKQDVRNNIIREARVESTEWVNRNNIIPVS